jgi:hypothetical protein
MELRMEMPLWLQAMAATCAVVILVHRLAPSAFEAYEAWRTGRNRAALRAAGLTPEQYVSTISPTDYQSYAEAVTTFWPRRTRRARRDATLDRIGRALGPMAAREIRELKSVLRHLD